MKVLVAYATRHGATTGIAERIGSTLRERGLDATVLPAADVADVAPYDAFVIGSAAYLYHWLKEANAFVRRHRSALATKPVWLFSSGPLGTDLVDKEGKDIREGAVPKEFAELRDTIAPRGEHVFWGAYDPDDAPIGVAEWFMKKMPASREALPVGDFRNWEEIDAWATEIADAIAAHRVEASA
jgi:menaquinone-dependent protoporphyrinogen oxidase